MIHRFEWTRQFTGHPVGPADVAAGHTDLIEHTHRLDQQNNPAPRTLIMKITRPGIMTQMFKEPLIRDIFLETGNLHSAFLTAIRT